ncbi:trafficking protein particle complex subunit [Anaeramoeba flamelloides]|uniref:Trafficking protein particle complex subunit n=1 Tax=Anaeramoeba flamelloides TaxID=1746091 RepID=A0AAV8AAN1_9EUKA|nr:trafficking protein particle complex subunit [Anaeramoeba flamelloides]
MKKAIIHVTDFSDIWDDVEVSVNRRLPFPPRNFGTNFKASAVSKFGVRFVLPKKEKRKEKQSLAQSYFCFPYLHIFVFKAEDRTKYRQTIHSELKEWIKEQESTETEWLVTLVSLGTKHKRTQNKLLQAIKKDTLQPSRCVHILFNEMENRKFVEVSDSVQKFMDVIHNFLQKGFLKHQQLLEEKSMIAKEGYQKKNWDLFKYFRLQESIVVSCEHFLFLNEAFNIYETFLNFYKKLIQLDPKKKYFSKFISKDISPYLQYTELFSLEFKPYVDLIFNNQITEFDFRVYIFAKKLKFLIELKKYLEAQKECLLFLQQMNRYFNLNKKEIIPYFPIIWTFSISLSLIACFNSINMNNEFKKEYTLKFMDNQGFLHLVVREQIIKLLPTISILKEKNIINGNEKEENEKTEQMKEENEKEEEEEEEEEEIKKEDKETITIMLNEFLSNHSNLSQIFQSETKHSEIAAMYTRKAISCFQENPKRTRIIGKLKHELCQYYFKLNNYARVKSLFRSLFELRLKEGWYNIVLQIGQDLLDYYERQENFTQYLNILFKLFHPSILFKENQLINFQEKFTNYSQNKLKENIIIQLNNEKFNFTINFLNLNKQKIQLSNLLKSNKNNSKSKSKKISKSKSKNKDNNNNNNNNQEIMLDQNLFIHTILPSNPLEFNLIIHNNTKITYNLDSIFISFIQYDFKKKKSIKNSIVSYIKKNISQNNKKLLPGKNIFNFCFKIDSIGIFIFNELKLKIGKIILNQINKKTNINNKNNCFQILEKKSLFSILHIHPTYIENGKEFLFPIILTKNSEELNIKDLTWYSNSNIHNNIMKEKENENFRIKAILIDNDDQLNNNDDKNEEINKNIDNDNENEIENDNSNIKEMEMTLDVELIKTENLQLNKISFKDINLKKKIIFFLPLLIPLNTNPLERQTLICQLNYNNFTMKKSFQIKQKLPFNLQYLSKSIDQNNKLLQIILKSNINDQIKILNWQLFPEDNYHIIDDFNNHFQNYLQLYPKSQTNFLFKLQNIPKNQKGIEIGIENKKENGIEIEKEQEQKQGKGHVIEQVQVQVQEQIITKEKDVKQTEGNDESKLINLKINYSNDENELNKKINIQLHLSNNGNDENDNNKESSDFVNNQSTLKINFRNMKNKYRQFTETFTYPFVITPKKENWVTIKIVRPKIMILGKTHEIKIIIEKNKLIQDHCYLEIDYSPNSWLVLGKVKIYLYKNQEVITFIREFIPISMGESIPFPKFLFIPIKSEFVQILHYDSQMNPLKYSKTIQVLPYLSSDSYQYISNCSFINNY